LQVFIHFDALVRRGASANVSNYRNDASGYYIKNKEG